MTKRQDPAAVKLCAQLVIIEKMGYYYQESCPDRIHFSSMGGDKKMRETHDQPASQGVANVLKRAKQYANVRWMPVAAMPKSVSSDYSNFPEKTVPGHWAANYPRKGLPYSSARYEEKYIGTNVLLETFMTALQNPKSVLYTRDWTGKGPRMSSWYGIVCSGYASYCLDLPEFRNTSRWRDYGDMEVIELKSAQQMKLGDTMLSKSHVVVITDIVRDETGRVLRLTVSESTLPLVAVNEFSAEEFERYWIPNGYMICRYKNIDQVTYTPSPFVKVEGDPELPPYEYNKAFMSDYGEKADYKLGEPVEFNVFEDGWEELVITGGDGREAARMEIGGPDVYSFKPARKGAYTAVLKKEGAQSAPIHFHVTALRLRAEVAADGFTAFMEAEEGESLTEVIAFAQTEKNERFHGVFTDEDRKAGCVRLSALPAGTYTVKGYARNAFGMYSSPAVTVEIPAVLQP